MTQKVDYDDLSDTLIRCDAAAEASESHGILCGMFCANGRAEVEAWMQQVMGEEADPSNALVKEARSMLVNLYQDTLQELFSEETELELLLPGDDVSIIERMQAISEWCQGFLLGFSQNEVRNRGELPNDVEELMADFVEITRIELETGEDAEEDENALMEIEEYVRMGVIYIMESLHPRVAVTSLQ